MVAASCGLAGDSNANPQQDQQGPPPSGPFLFCRLVIDTSSQSWREIAAFLFDRLQSLRARNDMPQTEADTNVIRGRIAEVKELLALPERQRQETQAQQESTAQVRAGMDVIPEWDGKY
jgi:hypothetical protein